MAKYKCSREVTACAGTQQFEVTANSADEAWAMFQNGDGELCECNAEVVDLGDYDRDSLYEDEPTLASADYNTLTHELVLTFTDGTKTPPVDLSELVASAEKQSVYESAVVSVGRLAMMAVESGLSNEAQQFSQAAANLASAARTINPNQGE